jgi:hypothetical protein
VDAHQVEYIAAITGPWGKGYGLIAAGLRLALAARGRLPPNTHNPVRPGPHDVLDPHAHDALEIVFHGGRPNQAI